MTGTLVKAWKSHRAKEVMIFCFLLRRKFLNRAGSLRAGIVKLELALLLLSVTDRTSEPAPEDSAVKTCLPLGMMGGGRHTRPQLSKT